jgi:hypothetical protein
MRDNPLHARAFGSDPVRRERRLLRFFSGLASLVQRRGILLGAWDGCVLVGALGIMPPRACRPTLPDLLRLLPSLLGSNSPANFPGVLRWLATWLRNDPPEAHFHLGPFVVEPALQGRGTGTLLISEAIDRADGQGAACYLETDKAINAAFYESFGFRTVKTQAVLDEESWFMWRPAKARAPT